MQAAPSLPATAPKVVVAKRTPGIARSTPHVKTPHTDKPPVIAASRVEQIYLPSEHRAMVINAPVAPMPTTCRPVIDPPRDSRMRGVFQCNDYARAGTNASGTVVLTGHSSMNQEWDTVFDHLSCTADGCAPITAAEGCAVQQSTLTGRYVYLRTEKSGKHWLVYHIRHVYCPPKDDNKAIKLKRLIWSSTPGKLLLVTCLESANAESVNNLFAVGQYVGVR